MIALFRIIRVGQSISQVSQSGDRCGSCGEGVRNQIFNRRWAAKCQKLVPDPPAIPAVASSRGTSSGRTENPTSPTVGSTCDVRRETNLRTCLRQVCLPLCLVSADHPRTLLVFGFRSALAILKRNRTRDERWLRANSKQFISRKFDYRDRMREDELARNIPSQEFWNLCFSEGFLLPCISRF